MRSSTSLRLCSGATESWPPVWCWASSAMNFGERSARSYRTPEAMKTLLTPGSSRTRFMIWRSGPWSVPRFSQTSGKTQDMRRQAVSIASSLHFIWYMLAVGPPRSVMVPWKSSMRRSARTSRRMLSAERDWMMRPSCSVMEQKVQPPKQPRMVTMECLTVSYAGIGSV